MHANRSKGLLTGSMKYGTMAALAVLFAAAAPPDASAYTGAQHYDACLKHGHGPGICGCARRICLGKVGATGDAGAKWNWIPGVNACWRK